LKYDFANFLSDFTRHLKILRL